VPTLFLLLARPPLPVWRRLPSSALRPSSAWLPLFWRLASLRPALRPLPALLRLALQLQLALALEPLAWLLLWPQV
jgi:hypothetical protein